jgi:hypothetical protein
LGYGVNERPLGRVQPQDSDRENADRERKLNEDMPFMDDLTDWG